MRHGVEGPDVTRRAWMRSAGALLAVLALPRRGTAAPTKLVVAVPHPAVGAIVAAVGGTAVSVRIDRKCEAGAIRIGDERHDVSRRILLKGAGAARGRFLDDARNASKLGANVRDVLAKAAPALAAQFDDNHRAWSRPFAKKVLGWQRQLAGSRLRDKRVRDGYGRIYLLEWAGAAVDDAASMASPASLAKLPAEPAAPNLAAYEQYLERLVATVATIRA
jgi:hypothetical protein